MNRTLGVYNMHMRDKFSWIWLSWLICMLSFVVNFLIVALFDIEILYSGGVASIYVYTFIMGILIIPQTFSFALGMGVRRTDYFLGTLLTAIGVSLAFTVLLMLLSVVENNWLVAWGVGLRFFNLPFVHESSLLLQFITHFVLLLFLFTLGFAIGSLYRKIGCTGLFFFFTLLFLAVVVATVLFSYYDVWGNIGRWIVANIHSLNDLTPWLALGTVIFTLVSYRLIRKATPV